MIILIGIACGLCWLFTARALNRRWTQPDSFPKCPRRHERHYNSYGSCCIPEARPLPAGQAAALAMLAAVLFPLVWLTALVRWQPETLRLMRSSHGAVRIVRRSKVKAGKALAVVEREALDD